MTMSNTMTEQLHAITPSVALLAAATTSLISVLLALPATVLPLVLNARAPAKDTLQSWTCGWVSSGLGAYNGMPENFSRVCGESVSWIIIKQAECHVVPSSPNEEVPIKSSRSLFSK